MEPLSAAASVVTLIGLAHSSFKILEHVKSRSNPRVELLAIINTVTDLQATLIVVREEFDSLQSSKMPATRSAFQSLPDTIKRLQTYLNSLIQFAEAKLLKNGKGLSRLGLNERNRQQLMSIRGNISDAHNNLQSILLSANLYQNRELTSKIEDVVIMQTEHHMQTSLAIHEIRSQLTSIQGLESNHSKTSQHTQDDVRSVLSQSTLEESNGKLTHVRVTTAVPRKACDGTCNCHCHIRSQFQTPRWLSAVVGTLFYSSSNTPSLDVRPCNVSTCSRSQQSSSTRFTYYFPTWAMRTALFYSTWKNLEGKSSSWFVRMPNEIPLSHDGWTFIGRGNLEKVRELLQTKRMSPFDMTMGGLSVLRFAYNNNQFEICSILAAAGADWHFKDRNGLSPFDMEWTTILSQRSTSRSRWRALVGSEDSYDFCLGPLHRIIISPSSEDLQKQVNLDPSRIEDVDWRGRTPLMWAALRNNLTYLNILLAQNALVNSRAIDGTTALHLAVQNGSAECVRALLHAKACPNVLDIRGCAPIHYIYQSNPDKINDKINLLLEHGACIGARNQFGITPLDVAVYARSYPAVEALLTCGANVNVFNQRGNPPILNGIGRGNPNIVELLCQYGTISSWVRDKNGFANVLEVAAICGTLEAMDILAESDISPVECYIAVLEKSFGAYHNPHYGRRYSDEEELDAFCRLLAKKAIPLDPPEYLPTSFFGRYGLRKRIAEVEKEGDSDGSTNEKRGERNNDNDRATRDELDGSNRQDIEDENDEQDEHFEDAVEALSISDNHENIPVVSASSDV